MSFFLAETWGMLVGLRAAEQVMGCPHTVVNGSRNAIASVSDAIVIDKGGVVMSLSKMCWNPLVACISLSLLQVAMFALHQIWNQLDVSHQCSEVRWIII